MAQAIRIFASSAWPVSGWSSSATPTGRSRELLARMTQRLQGCETIEDVIKVAGGLRRNIARRSPVNCMFWIPTPADALRGAVAVARR